MVNNSLDAALDVMMKEEAQPKRKRKYEITKVRKKREDNSLSKLTIVQHLEETDFSIPD